MFLGEKGRKFLFTKLDAFWVLLHIFFNLRCTMRASQVVLVVKNPLADVGDARDVGSVLESESSLGGGHGNPLWCSCLENGERSLVGYRLQGATKELDMT